VNTKASIDAKIEAIRFDTELKKSLKAAERKLGFKFDRLKRLIDTDGGVEAARRLLSSKDQFKSGLIYLSKNNMIEYSVEAFVVKFADSGLFDPAEIETAKWRINNAPKADSDKADESDEAQGEAEDESE
jgi:hypothetical protein